MVSKLVKKQSFTKSMLPKYYSMDSFDVMKIKNRLSVVESDQSSSDGSLIMLFEELLGSKITEENELNPNFNWSFQNNSRDWKKIYDKLPGKSSNIISELELDDTRKYHDSFILNEVRFSPNKENELPDLSLPFAYPSDYFHLETIQLKKRHQSLSVIEYQSITPVNHSQAEKIFAKDIRNLAFRCSSTYNGEAIDFKNNIKDSVCFDPIDDELKLPCFTNSDSNQETSLQPFKPTDLISRHYEESLNSTRSSYDDPMLSYPSALRFPSNDELDYIGMSSTDCFMLAPIIEETRAECLSWKNYKPKSHTIQLNQQHNQNKTFLYYTRKALVRYQSRIVSLVSPPSKTKLSTTISPVKSISSQSSQSESEPTTPVSLSSQTTCGSNDLTNPSEANLRHRKSNLSRLVLQAKCKLQSKLVRFKNISKLGMRGGINI